MKKIKTTNEIYDSIKSPLNYVGGKFKLLPQLKDVFSRLEKNNGKCYCFCDVFGGGMNVAININKNQDLFNQVIYNDVNEYIVSLFKEMLLNKNFLTEVKTLLNYYGLLFDTNPSSIHDLNLLKQNFSQLRKDFNDLKLNRFNHNNTIDFFNLNVYFYALICCGFNNNIRFNSLGEYNIAYGQRTLNSTMENNLILFLEKLKTNFNENQIFNLDYVDFIQLQLNRLKKENNLNLFFYLDPPYLISSANYGNILWKEEDEKKLLTILEELIYKNIKFALSNVIEHKGMKNELLIDFINKHQLKVVNINKNYNNASSYAYKARNNLTQEVVIINY